MVTLTHRRAQYAFVLLAGIVGAMLLAVRPRAADAADKKVWVGDDCAGVCYHGPMICCVPDD